MRRNARLGIGLALALAGGGAAGNAAGATLTGVVVDRGGHPVEFASVTVPSLQRGVVADDEGRWTLELPAGAWSITVAQLGYQPASRTVTLEERGGSLRVALAEEPVPVGEVVVSASSFGKAGKSEGATLRRMDIVMTPGGTADVFQSLRALPSINAPNEGAAVYVRGGDPHETLIRLDGGELGHPYHYEGASGGLFGSFDAYMLKSAFFSSGGFSSKYGGVMSGVLDVETQDPMNLHTVSVGANFVGGNVSSSWALVPDRLSFVGTGRFTRLDVLKAFYGTAHDYVSLPQSADGAAKLLFRYSPTGRVSLLGLGSGDQVDVRNHHYNYDGSFRSVARNRLAVLQWQDVLGGSLVLKGHATAQGYSSRRVYGVLDASVRERNGLASVDATWAMSARHQLAFGGGVRRLETDDESAVPADSTDFGPGAPVRVQSGHPRVTSPGVYVEHQWRVWGPVYATWGGRADYTTASSEWTADPRGALAWRLGNRQTIRVAAGRYHQLPRAAFLDPVYGNPQLRPSHADHVIAGYEWKAEDVNVRFEAYRKEYRDLVTRSDATYYANAGHGFARGVDVFVQRSNARVSGWVSYGLMESRRKELDDPRELPAAYGVHHSLSLVGTWQVQSMLSLGARWSYAAGRPYTPILGGEYDAPTDRWRPVMAENHSGLLPDYRRLDVRLTRLFSMPSRAGLPASGVCAAYVEALNVLGDRNVLDYGYSRDYSTRVPVGSYFSRRMAVAGVALTW